MKSIIFSLLYVGSLLTMVSGQVSQEWATRLNGPINEDDYAYAIAVDSSGNVYVTGACSVNQTFAPYDMVTVKYSPQGETLWVRYYASPDNFNDQGNAVAVDQDGYVYVAGQTVNSATVTDWVVIKYSPAGDSLWVKKYDGGGTMDDWPTAMAISDSGYIYVTGMSVKTISTTNRDYTTIKYTPNGDTLWVRRYEGPVAWIDEALSIAVAKNGKVAITGSSSGTGYIDDYATVLYNPDGSQAWVARYNGPANGTDGASAVGFDDSNNVYVTGGSAGSGTSYDIATLKYSPAGTQLWAKRYNGAANLSDWGMDLKVGPGRKIFVAGRVSLSAANADFVTIKYNSNGDTAWTRKHNGGANSSDQAEALAVDQDTNVYVTGMSYNSGPDMDYTTIKYDPAGNTDWIIHYDSSTGTSDYPMAMTLDSSGNVYVTGYSYAIGTGSDYATVKYAQCSAIPGDANASGSITLGDIIHVVNYIFDKDKLPCLGTDPGNCWTPGPFCQGDVNQTGTITIGDIVHLVNYIFDKDRLPCLGSDPGNCWTPEASGACCLAVP
ncbi:MAG: hypothetical protein A2142_01350 [candidate division Zixibacteria bacterium RBG_16_48_11]|nr:MAG: hypothetical protein A2142_01350 [candidate division Zixibacteria bacterium RBG_16_48_11]